MNTDRELMQQALEALKFYYDQHGEESDAKVITALRERLAQPEQQPVALETVYETIIQWDEGGGKRSRRELARRIVDLYSPPQRKPLTDEEIERACVPLGAAMLSFSEVARAIEAAHGIGEKPDVA